MKTGNTKSKNPYQPNLKPLGLLPFLFLFYSSVVAQETNSETQQHAVYFNLASYEILNIEQDSLMVFLNEVSDQEISDITLYGYTDDQGSNEYNQRLSNNRVNAVKEYMLSHGIIQDVNSTILGRGEVPLSRDDSRDIEEIRQGNRRVDIVITFIQETEIDIPEIVVEDDREPYHSLISPELEVGDIIRLEDVYFYPGRAILVSDSYPVLDRVAEILKNRTDLIFEIRGHVCCISRRYPDAIDRSTGLKNLSHTRAQAIYRYLMKEGVEKRRMRYKGYGRKYPLDQGDEFDRRVEIKILSIRQ